MGPLMKARLSWSGEAFCLKMANAYLQAVRKASTSADLADLMAAVTRDMGFKHWALIHHDDRSVASERARDMVPRSPKPGTSSTWVKSQRKLLASWSGPLGSDRWDHND
ncbi:hypothetical protein SJA_C1-14100 [Sphingobium indicum UT26S]|uniref:Uncharacterized protein n=1 Tax=Sphingobium indicum (strain DSM 16413 / CCM 7287 / MTCC 6362 / UT26 / NBRC 101211 / UT26S) TaxID=452662 RepID=D4Z0W2_SPHIU|nr:hypothetical protein SJA_C1-14100 [Sphingobium indicum UT26S]